MVGVFPASAAFADAARVQGEALGFPVPHVLVPHPVQDRTDAELRAVAEEAYPAVLAALTDPGSPGQAPRPDTG